MTSFVKDMDKYLVFKRSDLEKYLSHDHRRQLDAIEQLIYERRTWNHKEPLQSVVVESTWPIYDDVRTMVEGMIGESD